MSGVLNEQRIPAVGESATSLRPISRMARYLDVLAALAPMLFIVICLGLESLNPGYDRVRIAVSQLFWGSQGWLLTAGFCLLGFSIIVLAFRLHCSFKSGKMLKLSFAFLVLTGIGFVTVGFFPTTAPGAPETFVGVIHGQSVRVIAVMFPVICLLMFGGIDSARGLKVIRLYTLVTGVLALVLIIPAGFAFKNDTPWVGAIERAVLLNGLIWAETLAVFNLFPGMGVWFSRQANRMALNKSALGSYLGSGLVTILDLARSDKRLSALPVAIVMWVALAVSLTINAV